MAGDYDSYENRGEERGDAGSRPPPPSRYRRRNFQPNYYRSTGYNSYPQGRPRRAFPPPIVAREEGNVSFSPAIDLFFVLEFKFISLNFRVTNFSKTVVA